MEKKFLNTKEVKARYGFSSSVTLHKLEKEKGFPRTNKRSILSPERDRTMGTESKPAISWFFYT